MISPFSHLPLSLSYRYLDTSAVEVIMGAAAETQAVLDQKWDYIFYTGLFYILFFLYFFSLFLYYLFILYPSSFFFFLISFLY